MNEFNAQTGGRYVYVDDVLNLQSLALAFGHIFDECDNFIVSGCKVSGNSISAGYIYLNGKFRYFSGASGITKWPQYLYEKNTADSVHYASGDDKVGRHIYGVAIGPSVPTSLDALTNKVPVSMLIGQTGGTLMKDAFFGKYSLVLNPSNLSQVLNGSLKITGDLEVAGAIKSLSNSFRVEGTNSSFDLSYKNGHLMMSTVFNISNNRYSISMQDGVGIVAHLNDSRAVTIDQHGLIMPGRIRSSIGFFGNVGARSNHIYNHEEAIDTASLNINVVGFGGENKYFRSTNIGNGKGEVVVSVDGQSKTVSVSGVMSLSSGETNEGIVFLLSQPKSHIAVQKSIIWKDSNKETMGLLGFSENTDMSFRIINNLASVCIYGSENSFVDLGPVIKENGQKLSEKYVSSNYFKDWMKNVVTDKDVYSKTKSDQRYSKLSDGLSGYVSNGTNKKELRAQIGAIGTDELDDYVKTEKCLSDMAKSDEHKKRIRDNIGAVGKGDVQPVIKDTGWAPVQDGLHVRQIGNIVSIQGTIRTIHSGVLFFIPNFIDPPSHPVYQSISFSNNKNWTVSIKGGSRECRVLYCSGSCGKTTDFSITYMV